MDIKIDQNSVMVFDLDDTLYNEMDYLRSAYIEIAMSFENNWKPLFAKMYSLFRSKQDVFQYLHDVYGVEKKKLLTQYRLHKPALKPFNGVLDLFNNIKSNEGGICLITDGRVTTQTIKIEALGLKNYFDKIVISEQIKSEKPSEKNFKIIEESLPGKKYTYIADNLRKDFISPNILGWDSIGVIDNGQNMHYDGYQYFNTKNRPKKFVLSLKEIEIV